MLQQTIVFFERRQKSEPINFNDRRMGRERRFDIRPFSIERRRQHSQKREGERLSIKIPIFLESKGIIGETKNISFGGIMIHSVVPIHPGTSVKTRFSWENSITVDLPGQVVFCREALGIQEWSSLGISFSGSKTLEHKIRELLISRLSDTTHSLHGLTLNIILSKDDVQADEAISIAPPEMERDKPMGSNQKMLHVDVADGSLLSNRQSFYATLSRSNKSLEKWAARYTYFRPVESAGTEILFQGKKLILLTSNDHLGLTQHPKVKEAAIKAVERYGTGSGSTHVLAGTIDLHQELEDRLAKFKRMESAILFATGFMANLGAISTLFKDDFVLLNDSKNHYSIFEGCRASKSQIRVYHHNDMDHLERALRIYSGKRKVIITDSVFSMDGDVAPLNQLVTLAQKYDALVVVDEVFASGILGENGRGSLSHFGVEGQVDLVTDSFGKAFASFGGYVAGSRDLINYLRHFAMPAIFTTSLSPVVSATVLAALDVIETDKELIPRLWTNVEYMRKGLREIGYNLGNSTTQLIPVMIGDESLAHRLSAALQERGIFVNAIGRPAVPRGKARLRVSPMATHSQNELDRALAAFREVGKEYNLIR